jgi:thiosulfate/3-mercaptopyruvate sulfurtransferase
VTQPIVSVETLAGWIEAGRTDLRICDLRWYLGQPHGAGRAAYDAGHIPGAIHLDVDGELVAAEGPGRHPLPDPGAFQATLARAGIGDGDTVVAYDDVGGWVAARLWWMLEDLGFDDEGRSDEGRRGEALVLDGGWQAWLAAGGAVSTDVPRPSPRGLHLASAWRRVIDRADLKPRLGSVTLLDARAAERYRGEVEPIDPVAGHIPTARSAPTAGNLGRDGRFLPPHVLRERYEGLGCSLPGVTVTSCGSGVSACHNALAMRIAGLPDPLLYPGSYSDWSTAGEPVAVGAEPGAPQSQDAQTPRRSSS